MPDKKKALLLSILLLPALAGAQQGQPAGGATAGARPDRDVARDAGRHPQELLAFAGVRAGMTVVDFWPGSGYWSRLLAPAVGRSGRVIAFIPAETVPLYKQRDIVADTRAMAAEPGMARVSVVASGAGEAPAPAGTVDVFWTFQNYHDLHDKFMNGLDVAAFNRMVFRVLKPGGAYVIADHAAAAGSGLAGTEEQHRIDPAIVKAEVEAAGFRFDGESRILANPADPHTGTVFDPDIRGHTDQFVYRFRKPK